MLYNTLMENAENPKTESGMGAIIGAIVIIILLIAGGWYFISNRVEKVQIQKQELLDFNATTSTTTEIINLGTTTATSTINLPKK